MSFVHLHLHTQYSVLDASLAVRDAVSKAKEDGMEALAITDHGNLFGAVEFYQTCTKAGIHPIIGCEFFVAPEDHTLKKRCHKTGRTSFHLTLLAKNQAGYKNLCKLSSIGYLEGFYYDPRIDMNLLKEHKEGLLCLSGDLGSLVAFLLQKGESEEAKQWLLQLQDIFGDDLYLEMCRHPMTDSELAQDRMKEESWLLQNYQDFVKRQESVNQALTAFGQELSLPLVATNDVHYLERADWKAHEVLLNVATGEPVEIWERDSLGNAKNRLPNPKRKTYPSHAFYLKTQQEMLEMFSDHKEACANTLAVARKCQLELDFVTKHYPVYIPKEVRHQTLSREEQKRVAEEYLLKLCQEGIKHRYTEKNLDAVRSSLGVKDPMQVIEQRLATEMNVICQKEMCDYLLIVWDFIHWAKSQQIPVGPGRGSGAGSIVLYLIGVTDIEPLRFRLFFERFINPERFSYPDIDVDICMDRRSEVIQYTLDTYGKENVAQIITFGTMKAKMAVKDVGRVLNVPLAKVNQIAKLIPDDLNITLVKALEKDQELLAFYQADDEAKRVIDLAMRLEGSIRNTGVHAAGLVISGEPLTDYIPVAVAKDSQIPVTQYSMKPVEAVGMLKMDFLGLKTLTSIQQCAEAVAKRLGKDINWMDLPLEDEKTFSLLNNGKTLGVFQLESGGMQDLAKQLHLDKFEEIIAVVSLYRPGPMEMIPSFIERKHGREPIEFDHPWMEEILQETYGVMVYQEQVMQIAQKLANYSLGEGDILRRAMGKKDAAKMAEQREKFKLGCKENGIDEPLATQIFDKMEKFAAYGFNKSHAAAYGYITYVTAYLKANFPKDWMAALMTSDSHDISKVAKFVGEAKAMGIELLSPDINESERSFFAAKEGIRFGLGGIKGLGDHIVDLILEERQKKGPFNNLYHFIERMDLKKVGKKAVELLVDAGCFSSLGWSKDEQRLALEPMYESAAKKQKEQTLGYLNLFASLEKELPNRFATPPKVTTPTPKLQQLLKEKELLGFFLSGHPLELMEKELQQLGVVDLNVLATMEAPKVFRTCFLIDEAKIRFSQKTEKKFAILTISDRSGVRYELPIWPDLYEERGHLLEENKLLVAILLLDKEGRLSTKWIDDLSLFDAAMKTTCDQEFDQAKKHLEYRMNAPAKKETKEKTVKFFDIQLDCRTTRLSHLLELKHLFRSHPGKQPIALHFIENRETVATLHIQDPWGIKVTPEFKKAVASTLSSAS